MLRRRSLLSAGAAVPVIAGAGRAVAVPSSSDRAVAPGLRLARVGGAVLGARVRVRGPLTERMRTTPFRMVAVTWRGATPEVEVRVRDLRGGWTPWRWLAPLGDGPDPGSGEGGAVRGTELLWVGRADGVQVRSDGGSDDLSLVLVDPGRLPGDATVEEQTAARTTARYEATSLRPPLLNRSEWGANPKWRSGTPRIDDTIRMAHVHHTATANGYTRAEVPGILRGMYYYHTQSLGWSDIGYNFLIDRFGRIWVGRAGGSQNPVRGAHTLGFNQNSVGVAVIGNYVSTNPSDPAVGAVVRLTAWKLAMYGRNPTGKISMTSQGSDRYPAGQRVYLPVIDGHRDTNDTACPGARLYSRLPDIRTRAKRRIDYYS
ncbi:N-acetylmuramoyl-L-alanine amidase [Nocardioides rotundus]|uniref:peptidoglycan recognition protein family protein n=1 Tax=Nocardioides rotundus TaxID=1774216 RepID=UPI001CBF6EF9|nr:N-acetylmuramoyl-L-alanine amidase [Nocardioides rotundus]UAL29003.1 N-acetylmuramoyl-L-alanine amidase [Nocardioides rotundus]